MFIAGAPCLNIFYKIYILFTWKNINATDLSKSIKTVCIKGTFGQFTFGQQQDVGRALTWRKISLINPF